MWLRPSSTTSRFPCVRHFHTRPLANRRQPLPFLSTCVDRLGTYDLISEIPIRVVLTDVGAEGTGTVLEFIYCRGHLALYA